MDEFVHRFAAGVQSMPLSRILKKGGGRAEIPVADGPQSLDEKFSRASFGANREGRFSSLGQRRGACALGCFGETSEAAGGFLFFTAR